jgi:hypothetical protein
VVGTCPSWSNCAAKRRPQINNARGLGALPMAVLSVTKQALYAETLTQLQAVLPALSSNSMHLSSAELAKFPNRQ